MRRQQQVGLGGTRALAEGIVGADEARGTAMNLFKEQGVKDYAAAASQIPVIDYGPYFAGAPGALDRLVPQVRHACENVGFFYISGHGIDDAIVDAAFAASRRFHALPLAEKLAPRAYNWNIG